MEVMLHFVFFASLFYTVSCHIYGEKVGVCDNNREDLRSQICTEGSYGYVRLKTYDGRYVYAYGDRELATRAETGKPRPPRKIPGVRTTFKVHCPPKSSRTMDVQFEMLKQRAHFYPSAWRWKDNSPSGVFISTVGNNYIVGSHVREQFRLYRWRGTLVGIQVLRTGHWLGYSKDIRTGWLYAKNPSREVSSHPKPAIYDTFTIESVPRECVEVVDPEDKILAAPANVSPKDCESKPDRCYWDSFVKMRHKPHPHKCYYKKDSMCYQPTYYPSVIRKACSVATSRADVCEAANCCYDYETKECYAGKRNV